MTREHELELLIYDKQSEIEHATNLGDGTIETDSHLDDLYYRLFELEEELNRGVQNDIR